MLIAGPNLTIDRTICLAELRPGEVMRVSAGEVGAGGKGVNVVKLAALLDRPRGARGLSLRSHDGS